MITEAPIAFGLTLVVCLSLFFYCWYIRKLRYRLAAVQVAATPAEVVQEQPGLERTLVATFPTVTTHELKDDDELQCPICLVEYVNTELLRELPFCGHVFHIHCVDSWLQKHVTCPVCRIELTKYYHPKAEPIRQTLETACCRGSSSPNSVSIEIAPATPAWVLVNRPQHLPSSHQTLETRYSSESGGFDTDQELSGSAIATPLQDSRDAAMCLQRSARSAGFSFHSREADTAIIERRGCVSERWMTEPFSFEVSLTEDGCSSTACFESVGQGWPWRTGSWDFGRMEEDESATGLAPLTVAPEHCSFEFLPVVTGRGGDYSLTDFHR